MKSIQEIDGALRDHWYIAALSYEVPTNRPISRTIYGNHYALFRTPDGKVSVLEDRCIHRGAKLSEGKCDGELLRCPYHGWSYDATGAVIDVPSEGPRSPELDAAVKSRGWKIPKCESTERDGVIWVWCGDGKPNPETPPWNFPYATDPSWISYFMVTDFPNEVTHLVQNFMDVPHTVFVHSKWFRDQAMLKVPYELEVSSGRVKATYHKPADAIGSILRRVINPDGHPMIHTDEYIFPNLTRVEYRFGERHGFLINSECTPVDRFKTRVYTWIAYRGNWLAPLLKPVMEKYTRKVIEQDVEIMENHGSNQIRFREKTDWKSTAADEIHLAISRLRELGVTDAAAAHAVKSTNRERSFWI